MAAGADRGARRPDLARGRTLSANPAPRRPQLLTSGYAQSGNLGDEALLEGLLARGIDTSVTSVAPERTRSYARSKQSVGQLERRPTAPGGERRAARNGNQDGLSRIDSTNRVLRSHLTKPQSHTLHVVRSSLLDPRHDDTPRFAVGRRLGSRWVDQEARNGQSVQQAAGRAHAQTSSACGSAVDPASGPRGSRTLSPRSVGASSPTRTPQPQGCRGGTAAAQAESPPAPDSGCRSSPPPPRSPRRATRGSSFDCVARNSLGEPPFQPRTRSAQVARASAGPGGHGAPGSSTGPAACRSRQSSRRPHPEHPRAPNH